MTRKMVCMSTGNIKSSQLHITCIIVFFLLQKIQEINCSRGLRAVKKMISLFSNDRTALKLYTTYTLYAVKFKFGFFMMIGKRK